MLRVERIEPVISPNMTIHDGRSGLDVWFLDYAVLENHVATSWPELNLQIPVWHDATGLLLFGMN